jgi:PAS domain S-box-containing protein
MKTTRRSLKRRYIFFIGSVILTIIVSQAIVQYALQRQNEDAQLINQAGRQRMLSQRISKLILYLNDDLAETDTIRVARLDTLTKLINTWQLMHDRLILQNRQNDKSKAIESLLDQCTPHLANIVASARNILRNPKEESVNAAVTEISQHELPFLLLMERTVNQYQREAEQKLNYFKKIELALSALAIAILVFEFMYIFLPVLKSLRIKNKKLSGLNKKLVQSNNELVASEEEIRVNLEQISALRESLEIRERQYRELVENASDMIYELGPDGKFTFINAVMEIHSGFSKEELLGKPYWELVHEDDRADTIQFYRAQLKDGKEVSYREFRMRGKDSDLWVGQNVRMFFEGKYAHKVSVVARDITLRRQAERALQEAKEKAENATRIKSDFLSMISHEIRTPMNAIIGLTNLLLEDTLTIKQQENLKLLKFSGENLLTIINDILDFSKIEANKIEIEKIDFDLKEIIQRTVNMMEHRVSGKDVKVQAFFDSTLPPYLQGDPVRIVQIITNLMGNAVKFTEEGEVRLVVETLKREGKWVTFRCSVTDTGIGIPPDKIDTIFDSFSQAGNNITREYGGTGLGLAITRKLINLMGSEIAVESIPGEGSSFFFNLTLEEGKKPEEGTTSNDLTTIFKQRSIRVLLVEDNRVNQMVAVNFLQNWGIHTVVASNGKEAVELIREKRYDLVLMDLQMPIMNGYEATRAIRAMDDPYFHAIPIIALTASAMIEMRSKVLTTGMTDYMSKPFHPADLQRIISKYALHEDVKVPETTITSQLDLYTEGNAEFKCELIGQFIQNLEELKVVFENAITGKDAEMFRAGVHKSKTTVSVISYKPLSDILATVKDQMKSTCENGAIFPGELRSRFYNACDEAIAILQEELRKARETRSV